MQWVILQNGRVVFTGLREAALDAAERRGCIEHLIHVEDRDGKLKRITVRGRGFYQDGTEIPPRIVGAVMIPERMLQFQMQGCVAGELCRPRLIEGVL